MHPVVFEIILFVGLALFLLTQIVIPLLFGEPTMPFFRFNKSLKKLDDAEAEYTLAELEQIAKERRAEARRLRSTTNNQRKQDDTKQYDGKGQSGGARTL